MITVAGVPILLVMVPGAGMTAADFQNNGFAAAVHRQGGAMSVAAVDPGMEAYLDGSLEERVLADIVQAQEQAGTQRLWLAGISLGCQAILRCVRRRPDLAEGLILLTPYLASTGVIAQIAGRGGLRRWAAEAAGPREALLEWLALTPQESLPLMLLGYAHNDRFAATARLLADLVPANRVVSVPGAHDWESWRALWQLVLHGDPFGWPARSPADHAAPATTAT